DDMRDAPALIMIENLNRLGAKVKAFEVWNKAIALRRSLAIFPQGGLWSPRLHTSPHSFIFPLEYMTPDDHEN
ncbi:MAG: hypothetical protein AAF213_10795, partial [Pseudomonadota bacterium]